MLTLTQEVIGWKHKGGKPCALKGASTVWGGGDATPERVNAPYSTYLSAGCRYTAKYERRADIASRGMVRRWGRVSSRVRHRVVPDRERVPGRCNSAGAAVDPTFKEAG